jgi:hypothetical protein
VGSYLPGTSLLLEFIDKLANRTLEDTYETILVLFCNSDFSVSLMGCELVGDIFQAGVWVGAILVIGIIGIIVWMVSKARS